MSLLYLYVVKFTCINNVYTVLFPFKSSKGLQELLHIGRSSDQNYLCAVGYEDYLISIYLHKNLCIFEIYHQLFKNNLYLLSFLQYWQRSLLYKQVVSCINFDVSGYIGEPKLIFHIKFTFQYKEKTIFYFFFQLIASKLFFLKPKKNTYYKILTLMCKNKVKKLCSFMLN